MSQYRWYEKYPERFERERSLLARYQPSFELIQKDPHVKWRGVITVEYGTTEGMQKCSFCVDLVYPTIFPSKRIDVIPFDPPIRNSRHQAPVSGALCLMRHEPDDWNPDMTCLDALCLTQRWFRGHLTRSFGPEVQAHELPLYFSKRTDLTILLDDFGYVFPTPHHGQFKLSHTQSGRFGFITGAKDNDPIDRAKGFSMVEPAFHTSFAIDEKQTTTGAWYYLDKEPEPFNDFRGLLKQLDECSSASPHDIEKQILALAKGQSKWVDKRGLPVGLYHPGESDGLMYWLFVQLLFPKPHGRRQERKTWRSRLFSSEINLIPSYPARRQDLFRRLQPIYDADKLHQKTVTIVGLGALGSPLALNLVKAGVGRFFLFDGDTLKPGNVARHTVGLLHVGQRKVIAVKLQMLQHNPYATISSHGLIDDDIDHLRQCMVDSDLTLVAVANDNVEQFINNQAIELGCPVIYGYTLHQAQIGRIIKVIPHQTACRECLKYYKEHTDRWINVPEADADDYIYDEGCAFPAIPGAGLDTEQVANLMARLTIQHLLQEADDASHWLWVSQALKGDDVDPRLKQDMVRIPQMFEPNIHCPICGDHASDET